MDPSLSISISLSWYYWWQTETNSLRGDIYATGFLKEEDEQILGLLIPPGGWRKTYFDDQHAMQDCYLLHGCSLCNILKTQERAAVCKQAALIYGLGNSWQIVIKWMQTVKLLTHLHSLLRLLLITYKRIIIWL